MRGAAIHYSEAELAFVEARRTSSRSEIHAAFVLEFGRHEVTPENIKALCTRKGWTDRERWTAEDDAALRAIYADVRTEDVAKQLGRTKLATYGRAKALGLCKSEAFLASPAGGRLQPGDTLGIASRFQKGRISETKGVRRPGWSVGRMAETQFRKGESTWNKKPIGAERVIGGYHWTKVTDHQGARWTANWRQTHLLHWEAINGPMPEGMALKCLDSNRLNTDPSNWELVPRGVLPRLSGISGRGYDSAPADLKPTIMALAKLEHVAKTRRKSA